MGMRGTKILHSNQAKKLSSAIAKDFSQTFYYFFSAFKEIFRIATYQDYDESQILRFEIHLQPRSFYQD